MQDERFGELEAMVRRAWKLWNEGERDPATMGPGVTEDFVLESETTMRSFQGREGLLAWMAELDASFETWRLWIDEVRRLGDDSVLVLGGVHLRGRESGVELDQSMGWILDFEGNLVRRWRNFIGHEAAIEAAAAS